MHIVHEFIRFFSGKPLPLVAYTQQETETWRKIYEAVKDAQKKNACKEYLRGFQALERNCGYSPHRIPQLQGISVYLRGKTFRCIA